MNIDTDELRQRIDQLLDNEINQGKLQQIVTILTSRKDVNQMERMELYASAGGNVGEVFQSMVDTKLFSPAVIIKLINRNHYSGYYKMVAIAKNRLDGKESSDMRRTSLYFKLSIVLNRLKREGLLPFKDVNGVPIPITPTHCVIEDPVLEITKLISKVYG